MPFGRCWQKAEGAHDYPGACAKPAAMDAPRAGSRRIAQAEQTEAGSLESVAFLHTYYHLMLRRVISFAMIGENPMRVIPREKAMNTQSDIKMTDQMERDLIERELGPRSPSLVADVKSAISAAQHMLSRLQNQARKAKIVYANG